MTLSDKPEPGMDYIAFMLIINVGGMVIAGWQFVERNILDSPGEFILFAALCAFGLFMTAKQIHALYKTEYLLEDDKLTIRQGGKQESIPLESIESAELDSFSWRRLWPSGKNFCNRFSDRVRLRVNGKKIILTPTNPQLFVSHVRGLLFRGPNFNGTVVPAVSSPQKQDSPG